MSNAATEQFEVMNRWTGKVAFTATIETTPDMQRRWKLRLAVIWALENSVPCNSLVLDGADFSGYVCPIGSSFVGSSFVGSRFDGSNFDGSNFARSSFDGSSFVRSSFVGSNFDGSRFVRSRFVVSSFVGSSFVGSSFVRSRLHGSNFDGSRFVRSSFDGSIFVRSRFVGSRFVRSRFVDEDAAKADFMAIMAWSEPEIPALIAALENGRVNGSAYTGECACLVGTIANARGVNVKNLEKDSSRPAERWFMMISKGDKPGDQSPGAYAAARAVEWANEYLAAAKNPTPA